MTDHTQEPKDPDWMEKEMDFITGGWEHYRSKSQCESCKHLYREEDGARVFCKAFPNGYGVPEEILLNRFLHTSYYPGDHGVKYEPEDFAE